MNLVYTLVFLAIAFAVHEFCHALAADKLGDPTPRLNGRVTLNPLAHVDPLGLLALFILRVGWGKPVPINPNNFKNVKRDTLIVSLAGPLSNFGLALVAVALAQYNGAFLLLAVLSFNLGIFNLIPVYPLDGFKVVENLLPGELSLRWSRFEKYGLVILLAMLFPILPGGNSIIYQIINGALDIFVNLFYK
ncbi:MAG: site-2 protease family protein [bacterium]